MRTLRGRFLVLAKFTLSFGLLGALLSQVDINLSWAAAKDISLGMLITALLLEIMQFIIVAFRWKYVVHSIGSKLSFSSAFEILSIGTFIGQILPGAVGGDIVRIWKTRQAGLTVRASINSVLLERIATVLGLILLFAVTAPFFFEKFYKSPVGIWGFPIFVLVSVGGVGTLMLLNRLPKFFNRWIVTHHLSGLAHDTRLMFLHPKKVWWLMFLVILGHINLCAQIWVLAIGLKIPLTFVDSLLLVPPVILIAYIPISIGGWGVREMSMVTALGLAGISSAQSLVVSILFGLVALVVSLFGLVFWLKAKRETTLTN